MKTFKKVTTYAQTKKLLKKSKKKRTFRRLEESYGCFDIFRNAPP